MSWAWVNNLLRMNKIKEADMLDVKRPRAETCLNRAATCSRYTIAVGSLLAIPAYQCRSYLLARRMLPPNRALLWRHMKQFGFAGLIGGVAGGVAYGLYESFYLLSHEQLISACVAQRRDTDELAYRRWTLSGSIFGLWFGQLGGLVLGTNGAFLVAGLLHWSYYAWKREYGLRNLVINILSEVGGGPPESD